MSSHENDPTRSWATPPGPGPQPGKHDPAGGQGSGQQPSYGAPGAAESYQQPSYQQQPYGSAPGYGQQPAQDPYGGQQYGDQQYGAQQYGDQQYGAQPYGAQQYPAAQPGSYGAAQYGQPYGQYGQYGQPDAGGPPRRPASVVLAAILGFLFGALALLMTVAAFAGGAALLSYLGETGEEDAQVGAVVVGVVGILLLIWTVLLIWGAIWALTGRSRVLLLLGGTVAVVFTALAFLGSLVDVAANGAGGVVGSLLFLVAALAIVVPLLRKPAARFFAAHRARRLA